MLSRNANHHPLVYYATGAYIYIILIYIRYSEEHDPQGPVSGPPGFASREVDPTGAGGSRLKGLRKVYWWLAVIYIKKSVWRTPRGISRMHTIDICLEVSVPSHIEWDLIQG